MILHLMQRKGNGAFVLITPLLIAIMLFILSDIIPINDKYIGAISLILSGIIMFALDNRHKTVTQGSIVPVIIKQPRVKRKNLLMWIEVRYWAIASATVGMIWLINIQ
jgi:hypothetical protein